MTGRPEPGQIDIYRWAGVEGGFLALLAETGAMLAEMRPEPDGWWRVTTARGAQGMWIEPGTAEPWRVIVHRLLTQR